MRVLVVDDQPDTVDTLVALLQAEGLEAKGIYSGRKAIDTLREFDADVVILDIAMPGMSGWEVARRIRQELGAERPKLIAISGEYTKSADRALAKLNGFDFFLLKPCDPKVLMTLLASFRP